jgi:hypothetical protein
MTLDFVIESICTAVFIIGFLFRRLTTKSSSQLQAEFRRLLDESKCDGGQPAVAFRSVTCLNRGHGLKPLLLYMALRHLKMQND